MLPGKVTAIAPQATLVGLNLKNDLEWQGSPSLQAGGSSN